MDTESGKAKRRKSMRVATIFTGVAACTVGMTHAANAQDATHKPTSRHIGRQARPATEIRYGAIASSSNCTLKNDVNPTWLHLWWSDGPAYDPPLTPEICYGGRGSVYSPPTVGVTFECGGNNYGSLIGYSDGGKKEWIFNYHPGTTFAYLDKGSLWEVAIWSWKGADKCADINY
jgi:hypothetical protein